jgi:hypothetical protein
MCDRISISFARVASSTDALDPVRVPRFVPDVPVAVPAVVPAVPVAVSLPARFVMMRSIAATSVPQLCVLADAVPGDALLLDDGVAFGFSRAARWRRSSANCARSCAGIEFVLISLSAALA